MTFDKEKYWELRNNETEIIDPVTKEKKKVKRPLRGQGAKPRPLVTSGSTGSAEIGFSNDGELIVKNRAFRRKPVKLPVTEKKVKNRDKHAYEKKRLKLIRIQKRKERLSKV